MPPQLAAAIAGGAIGLGGNLLQNFWNQGQANNQGQWNQEMQQNQQRFDLDMWNRMNAYNSPQAQMARFKEAGLNPHLIYGKGTAGNTTPLKSPDVKPYNRAEMNSVTNGLDVFGDMYQFKQLQAQTDNTQANTDVQNATALLTATKNAREAFQLGKDNELRQTSIDAARLELNSAIHRNRILANESFISSGTVKEKLGKIKTEFLNEIKKGNNLDLDATLKRFEAKMNVHGLTKHSPLLLKWMLQNEDNINWEGFKKAFFHPQNPNPLKLFFK